ncbi:MAG: UDP-N-acetylglucosamine 1-carboxyvinyltransferase [Acidobacteriota bacterium]
MDNYKIRISGRKNLSGSIKVSGAKNASLPELAATILADSEITLDGIPDVKDVNTMFGALEAIGASGNFSGNRVNINFNTIKEPLVAESISKTSRSSILILGPLLARNGYAKVSLPGGCPIGDRRINFHLEGLERMGAKINVDGGYIYAKAKRLKGADYTFPGVSVTGTENLIMASSLAEGETVLRNCAVEPEVTDLITFLESMGAEITGKGTDTIRVKGKEILKGTSHTVIPDRIEMGTYVIAACLRGNDIVVENCIPEYIGSLLKILEQMGVDVISEENRIRVNVPENLNPVEVNTDPYPGFPTDLQAQLTTLLTQVDGKSRIRENIFNNRFKHVIELNKLGADIVINGNIAEVRGLSDFRGTYLNATDLRASASLVLGGLIAEGETVIDNAYQLFRGYEDMPGKLNEIGAEISAVKV